MAETLPLFRVNDWSGRSRAAAEKKSFRIPISQTEAKLIGYSIEVYNAIGEMIVVAYVLESSAFRSLTSGKLA